MVGTHLVLEFRIHARLAVCKTVACCMMNNLERLSSINPPTRWPFGCAHRVLYSISLFTVFKPLLGANNGPNQFGVNTVKCAQLVLYRGPLVIVPSEGQS